MTLTTRAKEFWQACSSRERTALALAAASLVAAAPYYLLLGPGFASREKLASALPELRAQLEAMRAQEREVAALRKRQVAATRRAGLEPMLRSALVGTSFADSGVRIESVPGNRAQFTASAAAFDDWIVWTEKLQREYAIRLDECRIAATGQPGLTRIEAAFVLAGEPDRWSAK